MHQRKKDAILRSKARWHGHGERNTRYFFNLEKRNHIRKTVTKLKIGDNKYVNDQFAILEEEKCFYESLYKSQNIDNDTFLESPFLKTQNITPLTQEKIGPQCALGVLCFMLVCFYSFVSIWEFNCCK